MSLIIGANVKYTKKDGLLGSVKEAISYKANTFMFYTGPASSTIRSEIDDYSTYEGFKLMLESNINPNNVIVHCPYIINLANTSDKSKYEFYINFLTNELERVKQLGFDKIVLHPGSATSCTKEEAIKNIAFGINAVYKNVKDVNILLEYMSGKGNEVGSTIDELKSIIDLIEEKDRIYVCLDTCHMNDAGINLKNFDTFMKEFDSKIGINKIKCVHLNDSMNPVYSHKDRHENIGYGTIGLDILLNIVYDERLKDIPFILETPYLNRSKKNEEAPYKYEIEIIRNKKFTSFK